MVNMLFANIGTPPVRPSITDVRNVVMWSHPAWLCKRWFGNSTIENDHCHASLPESGRSGFPGVISSPYTMAFNGLAPCLSNMPLINTENCWQINDI